MIIRQKLRLTISFQILLFMLGALSHAGYLPFSYPHFQARTAESIIAVILTLGLAATFTEIPRRHRITITTQLISLLGTLAGAVMIGIGVGPHTSFDYILHTVMIILFIAVLKMLLQPAITLQQKPFQ